MKKRSFIKLVMVYQKARYFVRQGIAKHDLEESYIVRFETSSKRRVTKPLAEKVQTCSSSTSKSISGRICFFSKDKTRSF
ncbi:hypothetical protein JTB14_007044 [Gonioctena quinquepunctata]|nr:hypothetical protein JTB14_007044 [Gonioctena quinquepunctata]